MMRYLPILDELFDSDIYFLLIGGFLIALGVSIFIKETKKQLWCMLGSLIVYAGCEIGCAFIVKSYGPAFLLLFIGTFALGAFLGFLIGFIISKIRNR
jgi:hypothetical protein